MKLWFLWLFSLLSVFLMIFALNFHWYCSGYLAPEYGYLAPEYAMRGHLTEKTDVFAFGVVALEIISFLNWLSYIFFLLHSLLSIMEWLHYQLPSLSIFLSSFLAQQAWNLREQDREIELVDSELSEFDEAEVRRIIGVAFLCTQTSPTIRPSMSRVVTMLSGNSDLGTEI